MHHWNKIIEKPKNSQNSAISFYELQAVNETQFNFSLHVGMFLRELEIC